MKNTLLLLFTFCTLSSVFAQRGLQTGSTAEVARKYRVSLPVITLPQLATKSWDDRTHTQHIELHIKRDLDDMGSNWPPGGYSSLWALCGGTACWIR